VSSVFCICICRLLCQVSEQDDLPGSAEELSIETFQSPNIQLFVLNNTTLLSLVEIPGLGEDQQQRSSDILDIHNNSSNNYNSSSVTVGNVTSEVRIILRDISGKFVWDTSSLISNPPSPSALFDQMNGGDDRSVAGSYGRAPTPAAAWNAASAPPPNVPPPPFPCAGTTTTAGGFFSPPRHTKRHRPPGELPTHEAAAADLDQLDDLLQYLGSVFRILNIVAPPGSRFISFFGLLISFLCRKILIYANLSYNIFKFTKDFKTITVSQMI
jgi:hypothetical protein